jgi:hypothetical protein
LVEPALGVALDPLDRYFHILGIDIRLDDRLKPFVLELTDRPSMWVTFELGNFMTQSVCPPEKVPESCDALLPAPDRAASTDVVQGMIQRSIDEMGPPVSVRTAIGSLSFHAIQLPSVYRRDRRRERIGNDQPLAERKIEWFRNRSGCSGMRCALGDSPKHNILGC